MFHETWYSEPQLKILADKALQVKNLEGLIIEIGCWEGRSTVTLANVVYPEYVHAVDTWKGNYDENPNNISVLLAQQRDVYAEFKKNIAELTRNNVVAYQMDCYEYLAGLKQKVKLCHIDACHDYASVKQTIRMLFPKLILGGILCGDDFCTAHKGREDLQGGVQKAVMEMCPGYGAFGKLVVVGKK